MRFRTGRNSDPAPGHLEYLTLISKVRQGLGRSLALLPECERGQRPDPRGAGGWTRF